jgi:hypothetical protein
MPSMLLIVIVGAASAVVAGNYRILDTVVIQCEAQDSGSGVASSTCRNVNAPAYTYGPGSHTLSASATDNAGNVETASTTFTVTATYSDLCTLTVWFSTQTSENALCNKLDEAQKADSTGDTTGKEDAIADYVKKVAQSSTKSNSFRTSQAATLISFAQSL